MRKVNLSRLHVIIRNAIADARELVMELAQSRTTQTLRIFERTTEEDLKKFEKKCADIKQEFYGKAKDLEKRERYIEYLKTILDEANRKYGITLLLLKSSCIERRLARLQAIKTVCLASRDITDVKDIQSPDFYKSAFTENTRIYDVQVTLFNGSDYRTACEEYDATQAESRRIQDETASINQSKFVTIKDYDEFE